TAVNTTRGRPGRSRAEDSARCALALALAERQPDREHRAAARAALGRDRAAVLLDDLLGAGQRDAAAARSPAGVRARLEAREGAREVLVGAVQARVADLQHAPARLGSHRDDDAAALGAVLDRVQEQVVDHPGDPGAVPGADHGVGLGHYLQLVTRRG